MKSLPRAGTSRFGALACLLAAACTSRADDPSKPFARISADHPMASDEVLTHLFKGGQDLCGEASFLDRARISQMDCLAHIDKTRAICTQEALARMPPQIASKDDLHVHGRQFYRCLMPA